MKNFLLTSVLIASSLSATAVAVSDSPYGDMQSIVNFLTANVDEGSGVSYVATAGDLKGKILPLSYYNTAEYWGEYVCNISGNNCEVIDQYNSVDYTLTPTLNSPGRDLQAERVNINSGSNIYDAATWQLALSVAAMHGLKGYDNKSLFEIANNQNQLLRLGHDGDATTVAPGANRGVTTQEGVFKYNRQSIIHPEHAYHFRMIARDWLADDPFLSTDYSKYIATNDLPVNNPLYKLATISRNSLQLYFILRQRNRVSIFR